MAEACNIWATLRWPVRQQVRSIWCASCLTSRRRAAAAYLRVVVHRLHQSALAPLIPHMGWSVVAHLDVAEALLWLAAQGEDADGIISVSVVRDIAEPFAACDLIVLATHTHTGLKRWTLGSVAERVLQATHLLVLVVRPSEQALSMEPTPADITQAEIYRWLGLDYESAKLLRFEARLTCLPSLWKLLSLPPGSNTSLYWFPLAHLSY